METDRYKPGLGKNQGLVQQLREFQRNPRSLVFVSLAESYRLEGLPHQSLEILDEGLAVHPGLASAVVARARCLFDLKRYAEALSETSTALRNNPQNIRAHKLQAEIYVRLGQRKAAIRALTQVVTLFPQDAEAVRSLEELENLEAKLNAPPERLVPSPSGPAPSLGRIEDFQVGSVAESMAPLKQADVAPAPPEKKIAAPVPAVAPPIFEPPPSFRPYGAASEQELARPVASSASAGRPVVYPSSAAAAALSAFVAQPVEVEPQPSHAADALFALPKAKSGAIDPLDLEDESEPAFATRTIAELYLRQGLKGKASSVLRRIVKDDPANSWARETLQGLESGGIVLPTQPPAPAPRSTSLDKKAKALEMMLARVRLMKPMPL